RPRGRNRRSLFTSGNCTFDEIGPGAEYEHDWDDEDDHATPELSSMDDADPEGSNSKCNDDPEGAHRQQPPQGSDEPGKGCGGSSQIRVADDLCRSRRLRAGSVRLSRCLLLRHAGYRLALAVPMRSRFI